MTTRLQVLVEETEMKEIRRAARAERVSVAAWVRAAMRRARDQAPGAPVERKVAIVRAANRQAFPTADIDQLLAEIERGYVTETAP